MWFDLPESEVTKLLKVSFLPVNRFSDKSTRCICIVHDLEVTDSLDVCIWGRGDAEVVYFLDGK